MNAARFSGRVGLQQRVLPAYRAAFCDALARELPGGLAVLAGKPARREGILQAGMLESAALTRARNIALGCGKFFLLWQSGWRGWLGREQPEALILEANPRYLTNFLLARDLRRRGRPVIGWSLGPIDAGGTLTRKFYESFSALLVYSGAGRDAFLRLGFPPERVFLAPNAVESKTAERLLAEPDACENARRSLGLDERPVILFVGRLQARKRVDLLLHAASPFRDAFQILIVGDGPERGRLEALAKSVYPAARFLGDQRGDNLGRCFLAADLFTLPGTGGLALQEALVYGKPVAVAEADGSQRDLVRPGENGWLLNAGDQAGMRDVLRQALADPGRLLRMGAESRRLVLQTATLEKMVAGFLDALAFAAAEKRS